ncbi:MAG: uracil-DNA glycosylase [Deltaproteobacteria bacterium]
MKDIRKDLKEVVSSLKGHLIYQRDVLLAEGVTLKDSYEFRVLSSELKPKNQNSNKEAENSKPKIQNSKLLEELRAEIGDCQRCKLSKGRTNLVFGVGNPDARIVFVGEGPGKDEDLQGEPFVGRAGQLLTDIITKGMKMRREDVYICNVVKCRPPENRNPEPDEIDACEGFLIKQLEVIKPEIVVALGTFAAKTLLKTDLPISKLRGGFHDYKGIKVMPTFHPSYLLRNPEKKKDTWEDIKMVIARLG